QPSTTSVRLPTSNIEHRTSNVQRPTSNFQQPTQPRAKLRETGAAGTCPGFLSDNVVSRVTVWARMQSFKFHPVVAHWFEEKFGSPTEPQERGWPAIQSGGHTLIAAPTGSGKTLAAFLASLDELFRDGLAGQLKDETRVIYVSPLKALSNDIHKNLEEPLAGIRAALRAKEGRDVE